MEENSILEKLEDEVRKGRVERTEVMGLKDGVGRCVIYADTIQHPDSRVYASGKIALDEGAIIGIHRHFTDSETWTVLQGKIEVNSKKYGPGQTITCKDDHHYAKNIAKGKSVMRFVKRMEED